jgi:hypothetical protein
MRPARFLLALGAIAIALPSTVRAQGGAPLRVIRVTPSVDAGPMAQITATFDRPVAGSLDRTVDATNVLRVEPAVAGKLEWRDPVTIRFVPAAPLTSGARYTVTVANNFRAMDGSSLAAPYRFTFRVRGPTLLFGIPVSRDNHADQLTPTQRFELVYTAPVDLAMLSNSAYLEFNAVCAFQPVVRLTATAQRRIVTTDPYQLRDAGGWQRDRSVDSLRRIVTLEPRSPLPHGCGGDLVAPAELDDQAAFPNERWPLRTFGDLSFSADRCGVNQYCPTGPIRVTFSTPVRGAEVLRRLRISPATTFTVRDTLSDATSWALEAKLTPRTAYVVLADTALRDIFGQSLRGALTSTFRTTGFEPAINHPLGSLLVERTGFQTLSVQHVNIDTLIAFIAPVPDSMEARALRRYGWGDDSLWTTLVRGVTPVRMPVTATIDHAMLTGLHLPAPDARVAGAPSVFAVRITGRADGRDAAAGGAVALVQVTDLGVHAKVGLADGVVWVTSVADGSAKAGADVVLRDTRGRTVATGRTDARGVARLTGWTAPAPVPNRGEEGDFGDYYGIEGSVQVTLGDDRAVTAINRWDPDLSPWRFNVSGAWNTGRLPIAATVFTERGIYRPGERVYAKAIMRDGPLGALRVPAFGDSIKWLFLDRDGGLLRATTTALSAFGTADQTLEMPAIAAVGQYRIDVQRKVQGAWTSITDTYYRVAEYRPPEFLVDVRAENATRLPGDTFAGTVQARYLFGAPMGRAQLTWQARQETVSSWSLNIPGTEGWYLGENGSWWEEGYTGGNTFAGGTDTLDAGGERILSVKLPAPPRGRAARVTLEATVVDINRQVVGSSTSTLVHPAEFYIAAKATGTAYFWIAGTPVTIDLIAIRPTGEKVSDVRIAGTVVRREWHRVRRERNGISELVGEWVSDTVARCSVTSAATPVPCSFTPPGGGIYTVSLAATDRGGRTASTSFQRWASGSDWVPWNDESQFKMDVIPDRTRYSVGDTATVLFASPFTDAEAWITVEREGLIDQRRMRLTSGATTLKFPITEAFSPNVFISIIVARGRSAPPGALDDLGRPTIRVGYAELRVTPEVKRLTVALAPLQAEYLPADSSRVRIGVKDAQGRGQRSEVTLWAVDEGVLALTGYKTPDPIDLMYHERGLGMRLASNMTSVAPQVPEGEKGKREPGGGGGSDGADVLRTRFQTTAFFLGSFVTDGDGTGIAVAKLPDNLTTFRVMAVAVTAGDRYGKGESSLLVTRPLLARPALPRFLRPGDVFTAGAVINRRDGTAAPVMVRATASGITLRGAAQQNVTLELSRGAEVRFPFTATRTDSATFRFDVTGGKDADAVRVRLPVRGDHHPVATVIAGALRDTARVVFTLPEGIDAARSKLSLSVGTSPLAAVRGMAQSLRVYPYYCTEQVISTAVPLVALYRAQQQTGVQMLSGNPLGEIARAVAVLSQRQREDGGIGYWSSTDWSTAWLSSYAGLILVDARELGVPVDSLVLQRLANFITRDLHGTASVTMLASTPVASWYERREIRLRDQVAAVDFLSRYGRPDVAAENELIRTAGLLTIEDRARLAEVLSRRRQMAAARAVMVPTWALVTLEGRRAVLTDTALTPFYFTSKMRPLARILSATLAIEPDNALVGPLVEALSQQGRAERDSWRWNTQDYASAISALAVYDQRVRSQGERGVRVQAGNRTVLQTSAAAGGAAGAAAGAGRDSAIALTGLLTTVSAGRELRLSLDAGPGTGVVYYYLTVSEIPRAPPVTPEMKGIQVERWYERYAGGAPITTAVEGDLVRVRLRITVPNTRQFVVLDDALPAGLEAIDLSLRTASAMPGPGAEQPMGRVERADNEQRTMLDAPWGYGSWDSGWWSPFDHREIRDDRVVYSATMLWAGTYTATYLARATTPGTFVRPPAHAEEMYNPAVYGRSDGGVFVVTVRPPR